MIVDIKKYIVRPETTIKKAYIKMLKNKKKIIFICNKKNLFFGLVTDGDFRRAFWANIDQEKKVSTIGKKKKIFSINSEKKILQIKKIKQNIQHVPIIKKGKLTNIIFEIKKNINKSKLNDKEGLIKFSVFVLAGGYGKRLRPITNKIPKALVPINNEPIISLILNNFVKFNLNKIYLALFHKKKLIKTFFRKQGKELRNKIKFIEENKPYGTAGPISKIDDNLDLPVIVTNCDAILNYNYNDILKYHLEKKLDLTIVGFAFENNLNYGICNVNNKGNLLSIEEKPKIKHLANCGFYIFNPNILKLIKKNKYLDMNIFLKKLIKNKKKVGVFPVSPDNWIDIGTLEKYNRNKNIMSKNIY
mgnify:FL=1